MSQMSSQETQLNYFEQMKPDIISRVSPLNDCLHIGFIIIVKCLDYTRFNKTFKSNQTNSMWKGTEQKQSTRKVHGFQNQNGCPRGWQSLYVAHEETRYPQRLS